MPKGAYYNEIDPFAAEWLRQLIKVGAIAPGDVDERSIEDVCPTDLKPYNQCHFFAGIGVWSYALRCAGWEDDRPVWTGSCPCQPFSEAGKGAGFADERHLWPAWFWLISQRQPEAIFGEQVASADGLQWFDLVRSDLEGAGYACGGFDLCAAGVGAPHIRQRLFFVADSMCGRQHGRRSGKTSINGFEGRVAAQWRSSRKETQRLCASSDLGNSNSDGWRSLGNDYPQHERRVSQPASQDLCILGNSSGKVLEVSDRFRGTSPETGVGGQGQAIERTGTPTSGFWANAEWLPCTDGKARAIEPGSFPLAHGAPARVGRLRGYGNAIVAPLAKEFIAAYLGVEGDRSA